MIQKLFSFRKNIFSAKNIFLKKICSFYVQVTEFHCEHQCAAPGPYTHQQLGQHLATAHGDTRHVCKYCAKMFKLKGSLLVHMR